ncbi:uncharacterized protein LOC132631144 [Lycium barbarum]|uniref:uncharacterized protein LOC132631144 n=1 Tax=Lycium barbarum TaxID=112863 RepID=UPI00293F717E|nr:uncharacterized protein LOC132631144 [Lycium barbarum]
MERIWRAEQDKREKDMEKKMEELLEKSTRSTRKATGLRYDDLCMHPALDLSEGFKTPKFEMFNRTRNPKAHLRSYCDQLVGVKKNEPLIMRLFSPSLTGFGSASRLYQTATTLRRSSKNQRKITENSPADGRDEAARVQPPMGEGELVSVLIRSQEPYFYDRMLSMAGRPFSKLVKIGEAIQDNLKSGKIVSIFNKASGHATAGIFPSGTDSGFPHTPRTSQIQSLNRQSESSQGRVQNLDPSTYGDPDSITDFVGPQKDGHRADRNDPRHDPCREVLEGECSEKGDN